MSVDPVLEFTLPGGWSLVFAIHLPNGLGYTGALLDAVVAGRLALRGSTRWWLVHSASARKMTVDAVTAQTLAKGRMSGPCSVAARDCLTGAPS